MNKNKYLCLLCNKEVKNIFAFLSHLKWNHPGITTKDYYDRFLKKHGEGICKTPGCNNQCNFYSLTKGYHKHCSRNCTKKDPLYIEKLINNKTINGVYNNNRKKAKRTCLKKYGVENVSQIEEVKEKKKETCLENNGYEHWVGSDEHVDWMNNGGAAYCNRFIKNPSKPQLELFELCQSLLPYPILNYPCLKYSIDIAIPSLNIAIEYDGSYWHQNFKYDRYRQEQIENEGWKFLRYIDEIPTPELLKKDVDKLLCHGKN